MIALGVGKGCPGCRPSMAETMAEERTKTEILKAPATISAGPRLRSGEIATFGVVEVGMDRSS